MGEVILQIQSSLCPIKKNMGEVILQIQSSLCPIPHFEVSNTDPKKEPQGFHQLNSMVMVYGV